jgi:hypothetical protein
VKKLHSVLEGLNEFKGIRFEGVGMDWTLFNRPIAYFCDHGNERLGSLQGM